MDNEPEPFEVNDNSTIEELICCIATKYNYDSADISILLDDKELPASTVISTLDLSNIVYFDAKIGQEKDQFIDMMFDAEEQKRIEAQIRQENIDHNLQYAYENNPENFIVYSSPFIKCSINGVEVVALIDTGAQSSIIPHALTKKCNVKYLIDARYRTLTKGVGMQTSKGVIHGLNVKVGNEVWTNRFVVLDDTLDHAILGIDWLKKNRALIDLAQNCLILHGQKVPLFDRNECN